MSLCKHCVDLHELPGFPIGRMITIDSVPTYTSEGSRAQDAIVMATDVYGLGIVNAKIVADRLAKDSGVTVYVPDYFPGGPIAPEDFHLPKKTSHGPPSNEQMERNLAVLGKWLGKENSPPMMFARYKRVVEAVRKTTSGKVVGVGYCVGGKMISLAAQEAIIDAGAIYHPALLDANEARRVKVPILLNKADVEPAFVPALEQAWESALSDANLLDRRTKTYPNTVHGFGTRPDVNDVSVMAGHNESIEHTVAFFREMFV